MSNGIVFVVSFILSATVLVLERAFGLGIDFHPDSVTYLTRSDTVFEMAAANPRMILNHGYYILASFLGQNPNYLVAVNMVLYAFTNALLHSSFRTSAMRVAPETFSRTFYFLLYLLLLFNLYRLHLSVHVLKDTVITFLAVLMFNLGPFRGSILVPLISIFRLFGVAYFILFLKGRPLYFAIFFFGIIAIVGGQVDAISSFLLDWNDKDFNFRQGTEVPTFQALGLVGVVLRMIVWPILMLSGFFLFLAPAVLFVPIALGSFVLQLWGLAVFRRPIFTLSAFGLLALIAALVPGFTTYQRYCLPILTVLPILYLRVRVIKA
ncbi:hypothetical protein [Octadecabacter ascidiaceicola]|uniref:Uncharacterized protein n=1 Tax=Octadecabacter ascidiaceicola TaxID=1655543 RepID=A0A238KTF7_9RHOB|nr:hypothetical protein [Octadecabacter ascidiaceicola]SMX45336.1 hypothetical protein OCA8868_03289 [Octadecabacter ascidiaceicola]